jgi:hypothetical protein
VPTDTLPTVQQQYQETLSHCLERLWQRLGVIQENLENRCQGHGDLLTTYLKNWEPRFRNLRQQIEQLKRRAEVRQSLVVMGKRGQGKSTLIRNWIGKGLQDSTGDELLPLPTGVEETTCCLVRLSIQQENDQGRHRLQVRLLPSTVLVQIAKRPPRPPLSGEQEQFYISLSGGDWPPSYAFAIMRYPVENQDRQIYLTAIENNCYRLARQGEFSLIEAQYHVGEVVVPLALERLSGHARQLLNILDIVDAPGADPSARPPYPEWLRYKNGEVFKQWMERLDLLLLVCSAETAAINLGGQLQDEVLRPWYERCQQHPQGRMLLVVTHSAQLLDEAWKLLAGQRTGQEDSVARKLVGNILAPLSNIGFFQLESDVQNWPPIFFIENDEGRLGEYRRDLKPDMDRKNRLYQLLQRRNSSWDDLPLAERCVLTLARDWEEQYSDRWPHEKVQKIQKWLIAAWCALLDEQDAGLGLLTDFVSDWAQYGPVARNHLQERLEHTEKLSDSYCQLLECFNQPDYRVTLEELRKAQGYLQKWWPPGGIDLRLGERCRQRLEQAHKNRGPDIGQRKDFNISDVVDDLVEDTLIQLTRKPGSQFSSNARTAQREEKESEKYLAATLRQCLLADWPLTELVNRYEKQFSNDPEYLVRVQTVGYERVVRILDYLYGASENHLRQIARYCYKRDIEENDVIRRVYKEVVKPGEGEDRSLLDSLRRQGQTLLQVLQKHTWRQAYV